MVHASSDPSSALRALARLGQDFLMVSAAYDRLRNLSATDENIAKRRKQYDTAPVRRDLGNAVNS